MSAATAKKVVQATLFSKRRSPARIQKYREARAIMAVAACHRGDNAPSYYQIAKQLGLSRDAALFADEIFLDVRGATSLSKKADWCAADEDSAIERVQNYLDIEANG